MASPGRGRARLALRAYRETEHVRRTDLNAVTLLRQRNNVIDRDSVGAGDQRGRRREDERMGTAVVADRAGQRVAAERHQEGIAEVSSVRLDIPVEVRRDGGRRGAAGVGRRGGGAHQRVAPVLHGLVVVIRVGVTGIVEELREIAGTVGSDSSHPVGEARDRAENKKRQSLT